MTDCVIGWIILLLVIYTVIGTIIGMHICPTPSQQHLPKVWWKRWVLYLIIGPVFWIMRIFDTIGDWIYKAYNHE